MDAGKATISLAARRARLVSAVTAAIGPGPQASPTTGATTPVPAMMAMEIAGAMATTRDARSLAAAPTRTPGMNSSAAAAEKTGMSEGHTEAEFTLTSGTCLQGRPGRPYSRVVMR